MLESIQDTLEKGEGGQESSASAPSPSPIARRARPRNPRHRRSKGPGSVPQKTPKFKAGAGAQGRGNGWMPHLARPATRFGGAIRQSGADGALAFVGPVFLSSILGPTARWRRRPRLFYLDPSACGPRAARVGDGRLAQAGESISFYTREGRRVEPVTAHQIQCAGQGVEGGGGFFAFRKKKKSARGAPGCAGGKSLEPTPGSAGAVNLPPTAAA